MRYKQNAKIISSGGKELGRVSYTVRARNRTQAKRKIGQMLNARSGPAGTTYKVVAPGDSSEHRTMKAAVKRAKSLLRKYDPWDVSVVALDRSGSYTSSQTVWPKKGTPRSNVMAGFHDEAGFHPIRASADYDPSRVGEKKKRKTGKRSRRK